jgi:hypothetical protein
MRRRSAAQPQSIEILTGLKGLSGLTGFSPLHPVHPENPVNPVKKILVEISGFEGLQRGAAEGERGKGIREGRTRRAAVGAFPISDVPRASEKGTPPLHPMIPILPIKNRTPPAAP